MEGEGRGCHKTPEPGHDGRKGTWAPDPGYDGRRAGTTSTRATGYRDGGGGGILNINTLVIMDATRP